MSLANARRITDAAVVDVEDFMARARGCDDPDQAKDWALAAKNTAGAALALVQTTKTAASMPRRND